MKCHPPSHFNSFLTSRYVSNDELYMMGLVTEAVAKYRDHRVIISHLHQFRQ